ncbi:MAG: hypothetical protein WCS88_03110 [Patescibacteria group bacterium]|jgi:hypothetical protein
MKKILLFVLFVPLLIGAACTAKNTANINTNEDDSATINVNENSNTDSEVIDSDNLQNNDVTDGTEINYQSYENKAIGYKILIPEKWYWRHFMKNELTKAGLNEAIDDYLILDKVPLLGLGSQYLGRIVVEKSSFDLAELKKDMSAYASKDVNIAGQSATRFELQTSDTKTIQYLFTKGDMTFRIIYQMLDSDAKNEAIFEKVVNSFSFDK